MTQPRRFSQLDVFSAVPLLGNPLAVVHDGSGLSDAQMASFADWTNLSETTFLLPPSDPQADYRVRIFTPERELPFAGHPTLGSCHAWLERRRRARGVKARWCRNAASAWCASAATAARLAFAAPPLERSGPLDAELRRASNARLSWRAARSSTTSGSTTGLAGARCVWPRPHACWQLKPDYSLMRGIHLGVVAPHPAGSNDASFEVRALIGRGYEDPVTGSLNASLAQWLIGAGVAPRDATWRRKALRCSAPAACTCEQRRRRHLDRRRRVRGGHRYSGVVNAARPLRRRSLPLGGTARRAKGAS